ncbi:hypothetical protein [Halomonas sp.]|uniref:hypothetical protein n=1 Tax=Halomonas sp. TaxID=1486246 RepID=UPI003D0A54C9
MAEYHVEITLPDDRPEISVTVPEQDALVTVEVPGLQGPPGPPGENELQWTTTQW